MGSPHISKVRDKFGTIARGYQHGQARRLTIPLIAKLTAPHQGDRVLDVATGTGAVLLGLVSRVRTVVGMDVARPMLDAAIDDFAESNQAKPILIIGDACRMPFADQSFDLVTCSRALHHITDPPLVLGEIARVMKPQGRLLILDNLTYEELDLASEHNRLESLRDSSHARTLPLSELLNIISQAGLDVQSVLVDEFLRSVPVWLDDAGTDAATVCHLLEDLWARYVAADQFVLQHFQRMADGEWRFRYRTAWVLGMRPP